jgi:hypothetical protein
MDATTMVISTTSSSVAQRRASWRLANATTALVDSRVTGVHIRQHKSKERFDKESLKKYFHKAKVKECAFLACLSDIDHDSDDTSSSSSDEVLERRVEDKLNGLCFLTNTVGGLYTMEHGEDMVRNGNKDISDDSIREVSLSADDLIATEVEELATTLASLDKFLMFAGHERKDYKRKYESMLRELESARASVMVSDETECDECTLHMLNITTLQTKYATLLVERDELQSRYSLLGTCQTCPSFHTELARRTLG